MRMKEIKVGLKLPFVEIAGTWKPDDSQRKASWEMYIELVTRIAVIELRPEEGLLREALSSLYSLFDTTRKILREYGPTVAKPSGGGDLSFGYIAVAVLNLVLRPVLASWHPLLQDWENQKLAAVSPLAHEQQWDRAAELRQELNAVRDVLREYALLLEKAAGVPQSLIIDRPASSSLGTR
jgi:hypothetical protein